MQSYLEAFDLWEVVAEDRPVAPLSRDPTMAQIKAHTEEKLKRSKAKTVIQNSVGDTVFSRIMACKTAKEAWDKLKLEYQGSDRTRQIQILNLKRDFESLKMKEDETISSYSDRIAFVVNKIRLLGEDFSDSRIVEKVLVTLPERFESKISSLEESKDLSIISLAELMNALQAQEQRRALRQESVTEGAFQAQNQRGDKGKKHFNKKSKDKNEGNDSMKKFSSCRHCKKTTHAEKYCWWRPDAICGSCKQTGHTAKVCKSNKHVSQTQHAQAAESEVQEELFVATCYLNTETSNTWLIDSGCTHHMCNNAAMFKKLDETYISKVKVGNGEYVKVKGRGTVAIKTNSGSFAGLAFLSLYLAGNIKAFDRAGHIAKLCVIFLPLLLASLVGISRVDDYRHHWQDVFAGGLLGIMVAIFSYLQFFPPPYHPQGWGPYAYFEEMASCTSAEAANTMGVPNSQALETRRERFLDERANTDCIGLSLSPCSGRSPQDMESGER